MTDLKVGFITPEDKVYWMTYDEVNEFKNLCIEKLGYFFFDWEQENKILIEKAKEYKIK